MVSVIPRQCSAITTKGKRCRKQAVAGKTTCSVHSRPSPKDPSNSASSFKKIALEAFYAVVLKIGLQKAIEYFITLMIAWKTLKRPPFIEKPARKITLKELGDWYSSLNLQWQKRILRALKAAEKNKKKKRTFSADETP